MAVLREVMESQIKELHSILSSSPVPAVNEALKRWGRTKRDDRSPLKAAGWAVWEDEGMPGKPYEWRQVSEVIYYRVPLPVDEQLTVSAAKRWSATPTNKRCPDCGAAAFAQAVCPKCAKGKAGIRKMWVCGDNSDHVFYTE